MHNIRSISYGKHLHIWTFWTRIDICSSSLRQPAVVQNYLSNINHAPLDTARTPCMKNMTLGVFVLQKHNCPPRNLPKLLWTYPYSQITTKSSSQMGIGVLQPSRFKMVTGRGRHRSVMFILSNHCEVTTLPLRWAAGHLSLVCWGLSYSGQFE